jgi:ATP-dependent helicase STH1/SNF2
LDSLPASREPSASPVPQPKKRGRKPGKAADKRKADEASLDGAPDTAKKPRRGGKVAETLTPSERATLQNILDNVYEALQELEEVSDDPELQPRGIIDPFLDLPPRQDYPDYYQLIRQPIAMKQIENKINKKQYQSLKQFRQDIGLLCNNCRQYNEDGSVLYNDANLIEVCLATPCI